MADRRRFLLRRTGPGVMPMYALVRHGRVFSWGMPETATRLPLANAVAALAFWEDERIRRDLTYDLVEYAIDNDND